MMFNEQVVPVKVWDRLVEEYRHIHSVPLHHGRLAELFNAYLQGFSDGLEVDARDVLDRIQEVA